MRIEIAEKLVYCPIISQEIGDWNCYDIVMASDGMSPERFAPEEIRAVSGWKEICQNCANNPYNVSAE